MADLIQKPKCIISGKSTFWEQEDAEARIAEINPHREPDKPLYSYYCHTCDGWHITKMSREQRASLVNRKLKRSHISRKTETIYWKGRLGSAPGT